MEKVGPGWNDPDFSVEITCRDIDSRGNTQGCGSKLKVVRTDMFTQYKRDIGGPRTEVYCYCSECALQLQLDLRPNIFKETLPTRDEWRAAQGL